MDHTDLAKLAMGLLAPEEPVATTMEAVTETATSVDVGGTDDLDVKLAEIVDLCAKLQASLTEGEEAPEVGGTEELSDNEVDEWCDILSISLPTVGASSGATLVAETQQIFACTKKYPKDKKKLKACLTAAKKQRLKTQNMTPAELKAHDQRIRDAQIRKDALVAEREIQRSQTQAQMQMQQVQQQVQQQADMQAQQAMQQQQAMYQQQQAMYQQPMPSYDPNQGYAVPQVPLNPYEDPYNGMVPPDQQAAAAQALGLEVEGVYALDVAGNWSYKQVEAKPLDFKTLEIKTSK